MYGMSRLLRCLSVVLCVPLIAFANPEQNGKSDCRSKISHSGFAEFVLPSEGGTHELAIKVDSSVKWTIRNSDYVDWIAIQDGDSGTGPGTMTIQLDANPLTVCRVGVLTIMGPQLIFGSPMRIGSPIRILQRGTETVATAETARAKEQTESSYPWLVNLAPSSGDNPQTAGKREFKKVNKKR